MPTTRFSIREARRRVDGAPADAPPPDAVGVAPARPTDALGARLAGRAPAWALAFLALVVVAAALGLSRRSPPPPAEAGTAPLAPAAVVVEPNVAAPQAPPDPCASTRPLLQLIAEQEQQGKYMLAASSAEVGLTQPELCPAHRDQLAQKAVVGRLQALWAESIRPEDRDAQEHAVDVYREAVALADRYGVPAAARPGLQVVADRAYQGGQFLLAKLAVDQLLEANPAAADRSLLRRYYASLRNLGVALLRGNSPSATDEGLSLLVAADLIDQKYRLEQGEAARDLVAALGPDRAHWPAPARSPLLAPSDWAGPGRAAGDEAQTALKSAAAKTSEAL